MLHISVAETKSHLSEIIAKSVHGHERFIITRRDKPVAAIVSLDDLKIIENEGTMNVMSVSLLRMKNDEIALFYLKKNSTTDCIPMVRFSKDEAKKVGISPINFDAADKDKDNKLNLSEWTLHKF